LGYNLLQTGHFLCKKHIEKTVPTLESLQSLVC